MTSIGSGDLDSLLGMTFGPNAFTSLAFVSGTTEGVQGPTVEGTVTSLTANPLTDPYVVSIPAVPPASIKVLAVNDAGNTISLGVTVAGNTTDQTYSVIGFNGHSLALTMTANAADAVLISEGMGSILSGELFALSLNGTDLGASPPGTTLTYAVLPSIPVPVTPSANTTTAQAAPTAVAADPPPNIASAHLPTTELTQLEHLDPYSVLL